MKIALSTLTLLILSGCCSLVWAADDFGPRFGSTAPYALQNDMNRAQSDVQGLGLDDLSDGNALGQIEPAAGGDDASEENAQEMRVPQPNSAYDEESEDELYYRQEKMRVPGPSGEAEQ